MPKAIIKVNLDINNIGPHYGINKISFSGKLNSNKVIFYALNGTGKSFISRTFQLATPGEHNLNPNDLLTIGQTSGTLFLKIVNTATPNDEKNLSILVNKDSPADVQNNTGYIFHVYNSDFVKENIEPREYTPDGNIEGYILGKVQIDLTKEKRREAKLKNEIEKKNAMIDDIIENAKKELRNYGVLPTTREFAFIDKEKLRNKEIMGDFQSFDEIVKQLEMLKQLPENLPDINKPAFSINEAVFDEIVIILTTAYPKAEWDEEFVVEIKKNRSFIEKGIELFDDGEGTCPFCKQPLDKTALELIDRYKSFLADKQAEVLRKIDLNIKAIEDIIASIRNYAKETKSANLDIKDLKKYFPSLEKVSLIIPNCDENFFSCFNTLISYLQQKSDNLIDTNFIVEPVVEECKKAIQGISKQQEKNAVIIKQVNKTKQDVNSERLSLRRNLCKAQYLKLHHSLSSDFNELENMESDLSRLQQSLIEKEQQARISKKDKVFETLEYFLDKFFAGKYSIDKETFQIKFWGNNVGNRVSKILSDGEKSIVAYCYYLASTHLHINREDDYGKLFFIIDDPVSSMDFHFVYAVAGSLRDIKAHFGITTYDRMWVFTHNLEFYSIVARNHIINNAYIMRQGKIEPLKHQLLMPYENHLKDIVEIASGIQQPSHTTGNSIRHVLETVCRFEYPEKNLETYITENEILGNNSCIFTLCQDLSHGPVRNQPPYSHEVIIEACKIVVEFMKSKYQGQIDALKIVNGET
jgi:hypothetical protein